MLRKILLATALSPALGAAAANIDGTIDTGYGGTAGRSSIGFLESDRPALRGIARSPFARYWLVADDPVDVGAIYVSRLMLDGTPDVAFGDANGRRRTPVPGGLGPGLPAISIEGNLVQADGKPLAFGGLTPRDGVAGAFPGLLCRLAAAGNFDVSFGTGGCRPLRTFLSNDEICRVTDAEEANDGSFVAIGNCAGATLPTRPFIARVTAAGILDQEFGAGVGLVTPLLPGVEAAGQYFDAVSLRPDGTIVVLAQVDSGTQRDIAVAQFDGGGSIDPGFGDDGVIGFGGTNDDRPVDIDLRADGGIVVLGQAVVADPYRATAMLMQLTASGEPDTIRFDDLDGRLGALSVLRDVEYDVDGKIVLGGSIEAPAAQPPTAGTDFWVAFAGSVPPQYPHRVMISAETRTSGVLEAPEADLVLPFEVVPGRITQLTLPVNLGLELDETGESFAKKGVHLRARDPIAVQIQTGRSFTLDTTAALPTETLGTTYRVLNWDFGLGQGSFFAIVATEDDTSVTITPSVTRHGRVAGVPYVIALDRGSTYRFNVADGLENLDTSGTLIESDKPIAVHSGHTCGAVPTASTDYCDLLLEQETPVERWGTEFLYARYVGRQNGDIVRMLAHEDGTVVSINGVPSIELAAGEIFEATYTEARRITSNKPIDVHQYAVGCDLANADEQDCPGDPNMLELVPTSRWQHRWVVNAPVDLQFEPTHYVQVIAPQSATASVRIDGAVVPANAWAPVGNAGHARAAVTVLSGQHLVTAAAPIVAYGHSVGEGESYAHAGSSAPGGAGLDTDDVLMRLLQGSSRDPRFGVDGIAVVDHAPGFETATRSADRMANFVVGSDAITVGTASLNRSSGQSLLVSYRVIAAELFHDSFE